MGREGFFVLGGRRIMGRGSISAGDEQCGRYGVLKSWDSKAGAGKAESVTEVLEPRTSRKVGPAKA